MAHKTKKGQQRPSGQVYIPWPGGLAAAFFKFQRIYGC
ncbi:hypothetical protein E6C60_0836 [Paenibacillus algicola]|uniref:Uncharacterized protein n=1 Tax=Paenibacillus algicola TaxID=2565926 RepID=A0A4P8XGE1_9BACL|nr:hypothetical protein E6C60_0836 [Paenibacillus algicola]